MDLHTTLDAREDVATTFYTNLGGGNKFCRCRKNLGVLPTIMPVIKSFEQTNQDKAVCLSANNSFLVYSEFLTVDKTCLEET